MFKYVWFDISLYVVIGVVLMLTEAVIYKKMYDRISDMDVVRAWEFEEKSVLRIHSKALLTICAIAAFVVWPAALSISIVRKVIVYKKIMKDIRFEEEFKEQIEEIHKKWHEEWPA